MVVAALLPTAALIGLGLALRRLADFPDAFWRELERLAYVVLLPALFVSSLSRADFAGLPAGPMVLALALSSLLASGVTWSLRPWIAPGDGPAYTSVFQGAVRFNNYVALVVITAVLGPRGLALAALGNAVLVPIVNVTSTLTLARFGHADLSWPQVARQVASNPLVLGCLGGMTLYGLARSAPAAGLLHAPVLGGLLRAAAEFLRILGTAALPVGLLCVGAGLRRPDAGAGAARLIGWAVILRFALVPALTVGVVATLCLSGPVAVVAVLFASVPTASSAYILARRLGGDARLMAAITAVQTVLALGTIPLWLAVGQSL